MAQTGGTANVVDNLNRKALAASVARSFGQEADNLGPDVLLAGAEDLAAGFQRVIPKGAVIDLAGALQALAGVGKLGPKLTSLLPDNPTAASGTEWQDLRRAVQERASAARGSDNVLAEDLTAVQDLMDDAAESALGPTFRTDFRQLREQWKNLKVAEELGSIKGGGEYPTPAALSQKLASKYGTTYLRDAGGVLPETQALFSQARQAARDNLGQVPNSGTATRSAQLAGAGGVLGLVTGQTTPEAAALGAALAAGSALAAPASVGREVTGALAAGAGAAGQAREVLERGRPQRRRGER